MSTDDKFKKQDDEYVFPYHYLASFSPFNNAKTMYSAIEYVGYMGPVIEMLKTRKWDSLLDVGCGDARMIYELMPHCEGKRVKGVDLSERAIQFGKAFNHGNGAEIEAEDVHTLTEQFDIVTAIETLEHIPDEVLPSFVKALHARIKDGGTLLISVPTNNFPLQKKHYRQYDLPMLREHVPTDMFSLESYKFYINGWGRFKFFVRVSARLVGWRGLMNILEKSAKKWLFPADEKSGLHLVAVFKKI